MTPERFSIHADVPVGSRAADAVPAYRFLMSWMSRSEKPWTVMMCRMSKCGMVQYIFEKSRYATTSRLRRVRASWNDA